MNSKATNGNSSAKPQRRGYENNNAWQNAMELVKLVYRVTAKFPVDERFNLVSQLRRSAVSIASNIAEGNGSGSDGLYLRHVRIACGSMAELETQIRIADDVGLLTDENSDAVWNQVGHTARLTHGLRRYLVRKTSC